MSGDFLRFGYLPRLCLPSGGFRLSSESVTAHTIKLLAIIVIKIT
jgi:hypothetical protein